MDEGRRRIPIDLVAQGVDVDFDDVVCCGCPLRVLTDGYLLRLLIARGKGLGAAGSRTTAS